MVSFAPREKSDTKRINVYYTTGTVVTCLWHPKRGEKTQLFRRNVAMYLLAQIFENARGHTGRGYYNKSQLICRDDEVVGSEKKEMMKEVIRLKNERSHIDRSIRTANVDSVFMIETSTILSTKNQTITRWIFYR